MRVIVSVEIPPGLTTADEKLFAMLMLEAVKEVLALVTIAGREGR